MDVSNVGRWETGEGSPRGSQMIRILQHYEQFRDYLIDGDADEEPLPKLEPQRAILKRFFATKTGKRAVAHGLTPVLSSIQFPNTPTVQLYRAIARELLGDFEAD